MTELILALMVGSASNTIANCKLQHSDQEIIRHAVPLDKKYSYLRNGHKITEMISQKGESWISINKDNKTMTYSIKCAFSNKSLVY